MEKILENIKTLFWKNRISTKATRKKASWEETLIREGKYAYFSDINYECQDIAIWDTLNHLYRMQEKLCSVGVEFLKDGVLIEDMCAALNFWVEKDFQNPNWWFNQIGTVNTLSTLVIMLWEYLTDEQVLRANAIIRRGSAAAVPDILKWTGANLIWGIRNTVHHAVLTGDKKLMKLAAERTAQEISIAEGLAEGIKPDMSFYQHGAVLYSCGYGRSFTCDTAQLIVIFSGSEFAINAEKTALFEKFLLEGQRYMMRGAAVDFQTVGREIARPDALSSSAFLSTLDLIIELGEFKRTNELKAYRDSLAGKTESFSSTKYFPYSYFLSHNTREFHISVKGYHTNYKGSEWGLRENRLGYNLNCGGVTAFMASGREYLNLNPLIDFSAIPGTTASAWNEARLWEASEGDWKSKPGTNDECDGWADGGYGVLYMRLEHDEISGYKSWFAFPKGMVCLGCAIQGPEPLYTTVDQAFREGDSFFKSVLARGERITNGGFCYVNLSDSPIIAEEKEVIGSWKRNSLSESDEIVKGKVFIASIDHTNSDNYAYAVVAKEHSCDSILSYVNTKEEQRVDFYDGYSMAVKRENGKTKIIVNGVIV